MHEIRVPTLNTNDESCILLEWFYTNAQTVEVGASVACLETSKAATDLLCEEVGLLYQLAKPGDECKFGAILGYLFVDETEQEHFIHSQYAFQEKDHTESLGLTITRSAQELMKQHSIGENELKILGKSVIKRVDVEEILHKATAEQHNILTISRRQAAIAETVRLSYQTIPRAFVMVKVYCDRTLDVLRLFTEKYTIQVGLPELLVKIIPELRSQFPFFFAERTSDQRYLIPEDPGVGVTIDVGKGLFMPVILAAASRSLLEIADALLDFRMKAWRETFRQEDFSGGHITISLNTDRDIVFALPIIQPSQTCMLSLGAVLEELALTPEQRVVSRHYVHIGLAYDHRVINGYEGMQFLEKVKARIESLEEFTEIVPPNSVSEK